MGSLRQEPASEPAPEPAAAPMSPPRTARVALTDFDSANSDALSEVTPLHLVGSKEEPPVATKARKKKKAKTKEPPPPLQPPMGAAGGLPSLNPRKPLPSISDLQRDMGARRRAAEETFRRNQDLLREQKLKEKELAVAAGVTEEDAQRRAQYLREQRDKLIAKKKAEREAKLKATADTTPARPVVGAASEDFKADVPSPTRADAGGGGGSEDDERRNMMRIALARRMKQDLLETEEERLNKMQAEQYSELDRKLRLVDRLREENRYKEAQLQHAIRQQQELRFRNLQHSIATDMTGDE